MDRIEMTRVLLRGVEFLAGGKVNAKVSFRIVSTAEDTHAVVKNGDARWKVSVDGENWIAKSY